MNTQTHDLTLHNIDEELYRRLIVEAEERGWSANATAQKRLRVSYGLGAKKKKYRDLSWMKGLWTKKEADEFDKYIEGAFEQIDEEDWK